MYYTLKLITLPRPNIGDITVNVTDGTDAISSASVVLTDSDSQSTTKSTDSNGDALFDDVVAGAYTLTVSKTGYGTVTETIAVASDATIDIELTPTRTVSFTVDDGTDAIQGAYITIDGDTEGKRGPTGSGGGCTATLTDGEHTLLVTAEGYTDKTETITVDSSHTSFTISLIESTP